MTVRNHVMVPLRRARDQNSQLAVIPEIASWLMSEAKGNITPTDFATAIRQIWVDGFEAGRADGRMKVWAE